MPDFAFIDLPGALGGRMPIVFNSSLSLVEKSSLGTIDDDGEALYRDSAMSSLYSAVQILRLGLALEVNC